jgi:CII-binding regulator of phage lambda lysogenization HflD
MADEKVKNDLLKFITNYTTLLSKQLIEVHKEMEGAVESIMEGINNISNEADQQTKNADTVLVGNESTEKVDGKELSEAEKNKIKELSQNVSINKNVVEAGNQLKKYMDGLHDLDSTVQQAIFSMMGKMSTDDVVRQKVEHIAYECGELAKTLTDIYSDVETKLVPEKVVSIEDELLKKIQDSFTMETEKEMYSKVFKG